MLTQNFTKFLILIAGKGSTPNCGTIGTVLSERKRKIPCYDDSPEQWAPFNL